MKHLRECDQLIALTVLRIPKWTPQQCQQAKDRVRCDLARGVITADQARRIVSLIP